MHSKEDQKPSESSVYNLAQILAWPKEFRRNFINGLSGFKSLCLAGTCDVQGHTNLSLLSSVIHVGANPPLMGVLFRPHTVPRHTWENILETQEFTLNHVREEFLVEAHQSSARYDREVSEFEALGLQASYIEGMKAPFVAEAEIKIGLELLEHHEIAANQTIFVVGKIKYIQVPEACIQTDGYLDLHAAGSLTVSGLDAYFRTEFIKRLPYAKTPLD